MNRRDWAEPLPKSNILDLSNNVCYDKYINRDYEQADTSYPDDSIAYKHLSHYYSISPKNIAIGYGSCELILRIMTMYRDKRITIVKPTWQLAEMYAIHLGMKVCDNGDILYIANPNGLTGKSLSKDQLLKLIQKYQLVIVDEAYSDFNDYSIVDIAPLLKNVIVVKTLSKTIASPGLRFGYCFANEQIIKQLQDCRPGYVTTGVTISALDCLLPQIDLHVARMIDTRDYIENKYPIVPSKGNYVLFKQNPRLPVKMKEVDGLFRMALTDLVTFKELENEYY